MTVEWKIVDHDGDHVLVEFKEGEETKRLNFNIGGLVNASLNPKPLIVATDAGMENMKVAGTLYGYDKGGILKEHSHDPIGLHTIEVLKGKVTVHKTSGDVTIAPGIIIKVAVGEKHSIEALEPSETLHRLV